MGCPQGSNSGPILWNVIADAALSIPLEQNVSLSAYADDIIIVIAASGRQTLEAKGRSTLQALNHWIKEAKMSFSPEKTKLITFPKGLKMGRKTHISFQGVTIKSVNAINYLGVTIDEKLTWTPHLKNLKTKCIEITNRINGMSSSTWGLNGSVRKAIYKRGTERLIAYASGAWWGLNPTVKMRNGILQVQRAPLLSITRCYRTVSTVALQVLAGVPPLDLVLDREANIFWLLHANQAPTIWSTRFNSSAIERPTAPNPTHPADEPVIHWDSQAPTLEGTEIYTDGSKCEDGVGAAFCILRDGALFHHLSTKLSHHTSIFQAELHAISVALNWIAVTHPPDSVIHIFSDSQSALTAVSTPFSNYGDAIDIRTQLSSLSRRYTINFHWIKSHFGHYGNETADRYAYLATQNPGVEKETMIPLSLIKSTLYSATMEQWNSRWHSEDSKGRYTATIFNNVSVKRLCSDHLINQLLSNHGNFTHYLTRFNRKNCRCSCNNSHEDALDFIFNCPQLGNQRITLNLTPNPNNSILHMLRNPKLRNAFKSIMNYVVNNTEQLYTITEEATNTD